MAVMDGSYTAAVGTILIGAVLVAVRLVRKSWANVESGGPEFVAFQWRYLAVYWLCTFSDWLKGPYVYALYEQYGFTPDQITLLFVGGFISSLVFGTVVGSWSDRLGRKFLCLVFCGVYAMSALTKPVNSFVVLFVGRLLSGVATSLLFTSFESWMVSEHRHRGFSEQLLTSTFSKATLGNGVAAILAGFVAQGAATCCGYAAPFLVAVPCLAAAGLLMTPWRENYGNVEGKTFESLRDGFTAIRREPALLALGACESLFEATIYVWVFYWTPAITSGDPQAGVPLGFLFSGYMASFMIGGAIPDLVPNVLKLAVPLHLAAALAFALSALVFENKVALFVTFALFEGCVGMYFPTHGTLRSIHLPETTRASVMNIFRFPMNAIVVSTLQLGLSPHTIMMVMCVMQLVSLACYLRFAVASRPQSPKHHLEELGA